MFMLFVLSRLWQTWSSPTWSPTNRVPASWPCAAHCAPIPPVERPRPSSPARNSHRNAHVPTCTLSDAPPAAGLPVKKHKASVNRSFIHTHKHTQFPQQECQLHGKCNMKTRPNGFCKYILSFVLSARWIWGVVGFGLFRICWHQGKYWISPDLFFKWAKVNSKIWQIQNIEYKFNLMNVKRCCMSICEAPVAH